MSNAGSTKRTSWQEALAIKTLTGLPRLSVIATSFVPFPHFVFPIFLLQLRINAAHSYSGDGVSQVFL